MDYGSGRSLIDFSSQKRSLSDFNDEILLHILCFVSPKTAIQTSILSKRWRYLWTSIPALYFTQDSETKHELINFVEQGLSIQVPPRSIQFKLVGHMDDSCPVEALIFAEGSCHVLEHLHLEDCLWKNIKTVTISSSKLKKLIIDEANCPLPNVSNRSDQFVIHGDDLKKFTYSGQFYFDYCILNPALLEEVTINVEVWPQNITPNWDEDHDFLIKWYWDQNFIANRIMKLLRRVSHALNKLIFGDTTITLLAENREFQDNMPYFTNLKHIELNAVYSFDLKKYEVWHKLIQRSPQIERLDMLGVTL
ncbi:putative F-box protein At3g58820 [Prosopis cineraria]|uniref:putative F-box protein At3g58820 n=1 Tax=Prosopis cineraria TaxID=364024 RepID=UPI00240FFE90|nr:putative F-box protein At3g58820 [Prosopis cineraria]